MKQTKTVKTGKKQSTKINIFVYLYMKMRQRNLSIYDEVILKSLNREHNSIVIYTDSYTTPLLPNCRKPVIGDFSFVARNSCLII